MYRKIDEDSHGSSSKHRSSQSATFDLATTKKPNEYRVSANPDEEEYDEDDDQEDYDEYPEMERESSGGILETKSSTTIDDKEDDNEAELPLTTTTIRPRVNYIAHTLPPKTKTLSQTKPTEKQPNEKFKIVQTHNGRSVIPKRPTTTIPTPTEKIPDGFKEIDDSDSDIPALSHREERKEIVTTKFLPPKSTTLNGNVRPDSYVTVTKQVTGVNENKDKLPGIPGKNYESTYYTKSSTCGYFTFTCNIVYGANGRSKICRPKPPTNGKC